MFRYILNGDEERSQNSMQKREQMIPEEQGTQGTVKGSVGSRQDGVPETSTVRETDLTRRRAEGKLFIHE